MRESAESDEVRTIAHVRTLAVLPSLDNRRKGNVLQFLHESDLINKNTPIILLSGADLCRVDPSGTFRKAFPLEVYQDIVDTPWENIAAQFGADLSRAHLWGAILNGADLSRANLHDANLRSADLRGADLHDADLTGANLHDANLHDADLSGADLSGAVITKKQLNQAKSLENAVLPAIP